MNKKFIIGIVSIIVIVVFFLVVDKKDTIPKYDADIVCSYSNTEVLDEENYESKSIVYIYKDGDNVKKSISQSIVSSNSDTKLLESIISLYEDIEGIEAKITTIDDSIVFEVVYDFDKIDLELTKEKLGNVLSDSSILMTASELPISVEYYLDSLNSNYKCEVK